MSRRTLAKLVVPVSEPHRREPEPDYLLWRHIKDMTGDQNRFSGYNDNGGISMNRQNTDLSVLDARTGLPIVPSAEPSPPPSNDVGEESDLEELLDYRSVPLQSGRTVLVRFSQRGRLEPLPYALDEDDS